MKDKEFGTVRRSVYFSLADGGYKKIFAKSQRQEFGDQAKRLIVTHKIAIERVQQAMKCPGISEFLTDSYTYGGGDSGPENEFLLLDEIIAAGS